MGATTVAKQTGAPPVPPGGDDDKVTTWKVRRRVAKTLRLIGAHLDCNQESVMDLFEREFENYLLTLQARDAAERKRKQAE